MGARIVQDLGRRVSEDDIMLTAQSYPDGASPAEDAHAADPLPRSKAPFLVSIDGAAPGNPQIDPTSLAEDAVAVVARWLTAARAIETAAERRSSERMRAIIEDPAGVSFTMRFVDRVARHRRDALAAEQLAQLVVDAGLPGFLGRFDRFLLTLGGRLAPTF
ncbi:MAG TPA: hypothetical protein DGF10_07340, partial [Acidimicrobiaceae bacterium]|nr:hypothetical protein [Acidimicrobiaceae bacterium]